MFKALLTAYLIALGCLLYAASPDPAAWYRPLNEDYLPSNEWIALMYLEDSRGDLHEVEYSMYIDPETGAVIESGLQQSLSNLKLSLNTVVDVLDETTRVAVENAWQIEKLHAQFTALGKNLTQVFQVDGMEIVVDDKTYRLKMSKGSLREAITTGTSVKYEDVDGMLKTNDPDEKSINLINKELQIRGWSTEDSKKALVADVVGGDIPFRTKKGGALEYRKWEGIDMSSIGYNAAKQFEIKNWSTAKACGENLTSLLTDPVGPDVGQHLILTKAGDNLHYLPLGKGIITNSAAVVVDEKSITKLTETSESGEKTSKLALMGYKDAGGTKDSPAIPYSGDGDNLLWQSFLTFFNPNMFESKNGKINIKGLDGDNEEIRILTVKGGDNGAAITSNSMKTFIDPPLEWRDNKITVSGYDIAQEGEYLCRTKTGVEWKEVEDSILADEKAITTNATPFKAFTLVGYGNAKENMIPFKDASTLSWQKINDFLDKAIDRKSIALNSEDELEVKGASSVTSPRKYFGSSTTSSHIGWYDLPNVTTNRVDVDEITLTTDNSANGKVKTIRWKSTPPAAPSLAMMGGNGIEWIPYDGVTNRNAIVGVDDVSVETNENGNLQIKGWKNQESCGADLASMLTDVDDSNRDDHEILCRVGGQIHYLPLNQSVIDKIEVDADTIIEKVDGTIGLDGSYGAEEGTVPHRTAYGLEWKKVETPDIKADDPLSVDVESDGSLKLSINDDVLCKCDLHNRPVADETTIFENDDGVWSVGEDFVRADSMTNAINEAVSNATCNVKFDGLTIVDIYGDDTYGLVGSYEAEPNSMLVKDEESNYVWLPIEQFKNDIDIDGDTIVWKGDGTIGLNESWNAAPGSVPTRSENGLKWIEPQTMEVLTDVQWDDSTKTFKKTYKTVEFYGKVVETE